MKIKSKKIPSFQERPLPIKSLQRKAKKVKQVDVLSKMEPTILLTPKNKLPVSTNLFVSNLDPQITESYLMEMFRTYGLLANVKVNFLKNYFCFFVYSRRMWNKTTTQRYKNINYLKIINFLYDFTTE